MVRSTKSLFHSGKWWAKLESQICLTLQYKLLIHCAGWPTLEIKEEFPEELTVAGFPNRLRSFPGVQRKRAF